MHITGSIFGAALNFRGIMDGLEGSLHLDPYKKPPEAPVLYIKPRNTWIRDGDPIPCPQGVQQLRMGGTLGVVIGRPAYQVAEEDALDFVGGYTVVNDVSIPHAFYFRPAIRERCSDGFLPLGSFVEREEVADPGALEIRIFVNGRMEAQNTTANLVRPVALLIQDVTEFMTLHPGDILLMGEPDNAPLAGPGDFVWIEIDRVGCIGNAIMAENK